MKFTDSNDEQVEQFWKGVVMSFDVDKTRRIQEMIKEREDAYLDGERDEPVTAQEIEEIMDGVLNNGLV